MDKTKVAIADKQTLFRAGVYHALSQLPDLEVFESIPCDNLIEALEKESTNVILLDIDTPSLSGLDLAKKITLRCPTVKIIVFTLNPDDKQLFEIIKSGAAAYLEKDVTKEELTDSIRRVSQGESPINESVLTRPELATHLLKQFRSIHGNNKNSCENVLVSLTAREIQILNYIADGNSNKQIAIILTISQQTVKNHVSNILRKLNANDRAHAVFLAIRYGWILAGSVNNEMPVSNN